MAAATEVFAPIYRNVRERIESLPDSEKYHFLEKYFPIQLSQAGRAGREAMVERAPGLDAVGRNNGKSMPARQTRLITAKS